jgi:UDP-3-O-[3-hydroxymyristoyl] N-acetylglucosamine deacetylase
METNFFSSPQGYRVQKTLKHTLVFEGVGLHTGRVTKIHLIPAPPNHGIVFQRTDCARPVRVFAHYDAVISTELATSLGYRGMEDARINTVEHVLAALFAMGITNCLVEVNGPEIPILDGSAAPFIEAIWDEGIEIQPFSNPTLKILKPIKVYQNGAICELLPRDCLRLTTSIDFPHPAIGAQTFALEMTPEAFKEQVGRARTFGFVRDLEKLQKVHLAQGASLANVLAFSEKGVVNPEGARFADECVRHKLLDAVGDLALCGSWIEGEMVSFRGGHAIHMALLQALKSFRSHWEMLPAEPLPNFSFTLSQPEPERPRFLS